MKLEPHILTTLRQKLSTQAIDLAHASPDLVSFGTPALDQSLTGGLARAALHEACASGTADVAAMTGFALALAARAAAERPIVWVRQDFVDTETGHLYPPGLAEFGLDPDRVLLVRVRDMGDAFRAGAEAVRCPSLGAVLIEPWGMAQAVDLVTSRRLSLAAEASGVMTLLLRIAANPAPGAAKTRWLVRAMPSQPLAANAPGNPAFALTLLRHRGGVAGQEWCVEWNRDKRCFENKKGSNATPIPRPVAGIPTSRPASAVHGILREAG